MGGDLRSELAGFRDASAAPVMDPADARDRLARLMDCVGQTEAARTVRGWGLSGAGDEPDVPAPVGEVLRCPACSHLLKLANWRVVCGGCGDGERVGAEGAD